MCDDIVFVIIAICVLGFLLGSAVYHVREAACKNCPHRKICEDLMKNNQPNICEQSDNMIDKCQQMNYL